jgi:RNA polymerase sigma-70 factor (ECF subfamily)
VVTTADTTAEVTTTNAAFDSQDPGGRPEEGAAAARTRTLYEQHHQTVSVICRALLRDRSEAEDAAQQTFLSAHRALLNGVEPREPAAWLATIARNECWARIKSRMREPLPIDVEAVGTGDPVAEAVRRADLAALRGAIASLPPQQRDAVVLREFAGLRYDELAAALGVTQPAVESLLFRARTQLRTKLRAAYASVTGASALEWLVRAVAGGTPVAAKVAVLGFGTAAVTGSAVVVPDVVDRHRQVTPSHVQRVRAVHMRARRPHRVPAAPVVVISHVQRTHEDRTVTTAIPKQAAGHEAVARGGDQEATTTLPVDRPAQEGPSDTTPAPPLGDSSGPGPGDDTPLSPAEGSGSSGSGEDGHGGGSGSDGSGGRGGESGPGGG